MRRTSIKNKLILFFLMLILVVMVVVAAVNLITENFYLAQGLSSAIALTMGIVFGGFFSSSIVTRINRFSKAAREVSNGDLTREIPVVSNDEIRDLEEVFNVMVTHIRSLIMDVRAISVQIQASANMLNALSKDIMGESLEIDGSSQSISEKSENQTTIIQDISLKLDNITGAIKKRADQSDPQKETSDKQVKQIQSISKQFKKLAQLAEHNLLSAQNAVKATALQKDKADKVADTLDLLRELVKQIVRTQERFQLPETGE
jgi:methyl-accepting chemotaxis protein